MARLQTNKNVTICRPGLRLTCSFVQANRLEASSINAVCKVVCTKVANEAKKANKCSSNWKKAPIMQKAE